MNAIARMPRTLALDRGEACHQKRGTDANAEYPKQFCYGAHHVRTASNTNTTARMQRTPTATPSIQLPFLPGCSFRSGWSWRRTACQLKGFIRPRCLMQGGENRHQQTSAGEHAEQPQELPFAARLHLVLAAGRLSGPGNKRIHSDVPPYSVSIGGFLEIRPSLLGRGPERHYSGGDLVTAR